MSFQPNPGDSILINGKSYKVGQHPAAPGLAYAQAGRQGIVYQLVPQDGGPEEAKALKVFFPKFRIPAMVYQSETMEIYSESPGLQVCKRDVLTPERNGELITEHPDLLYAVLMPWVYGVTWFDVIAEQKRLARTESLALAKALAAIGSGMEQRGLAHCDLSAPNVMLPFFSEVDMPGNKSVVELVDVEQMYSPKMDRPDVLLSGSPGYAAHRTVQSGLWSAYADRFAGAIIMAEMLGWCDSHVVEKAWGESYFDQHEMQNPCERYFVLKKSLERNWGNKVAELFARAWESQDISSCPTFGEWLVVLSAMNGEPPIGEAEPELDGGKGGAPARSPGALESAAAAVLPEEPPLPPVGEKGAAQAGKDHGVVDRLFHQAREMERKGDLKGALEVYRSAHHFVPAGSPMQIELEAAIAGLEETLNPKPEEQAAGKVPFYRSRKWLAAAAAALVLIGGSGFAVNQILADQAEKREAEAAEKLSKQQEEARKAELQEEEKRKQAEAEEKRRQAEAEGKRKQEEDKALARQKAEKQKLQEKYEQQAKYEAYLAQKKLAEEKQKAAEKKRLQELYDKQAKYEAYLKQQKILKQKLEEQRIQKAKEEAARKQQEARELQKRRSNQVVQLIASYNQAYNAQKGGNTSKARLYALSFINLYEKDSAYFKTVGKVSSRANAIYKFLANTGYILPNI
ncbi:MULTISPECIES: hypothetical protein [Paenibacillus]|uniref:Protein kinase domain-containing protein n=1 Tax=Paenibacillus albilobatus TaxID=2716884 RepID=A0A919XBZ8_9BACL|nr:MULTISPECIES: hypothetical protein [Paenibacillus]GIO29871.1 hypothetical protein J2TS6_10120 [Paenibacillus albilobatus]